jgi:hypothetical protein
VQRFVVLRASEKRPLAGLSDLFEVMSSGFSGLNARWKKQLDEGALGAVHPAGTCQCTLIFRQIGESILISRDNPSVGRWTSSRAQPSASAFNPTQNPAKGSGLRAHHLKPQPS